MRSFSSAKTCLFIFRFCSRILSHLRYLCRKFPFIFEGYNAYLDHLGMLVANPLGISFATFSLCSIFSPACVRARACVCYVGREVVLSHFSCYVGQTLQLGMCTPKSLFTASSGPHPWRTARGCRKGVGWPWVPGWLQDSGRGFCRRGGPQWPFSPSLVST